MKQTYFWKRDLWLILLGVSIFALGVVWFGRPVGTGYRRIFGTFHSHSRIDT